jgi:AcrR family transcriptional regulator
MAEQRVRRRQEERTALSDQKMTQAAIQLLLESGIEGTTFAGIGERAGYSRGLVTHRFGSKAGLLAHIHDVVARDWIARVQEAVGESGGIEALERVIGALHGFIVEEPDEIRAMYLLRYASIDPCSEFRTNVAKVHKAQRRDVQRWIEAGKDEGTVPGTVDAGLAAELFCSAADGLVYRWLVNPRLPMRDLYDLLKRIVSRSLAAASH